eukprot:358640-Chlamydomonas_euryale.AAC.2
MHGRHPSAVRRLTCLPHPARLLMGAWLDICGPVLLMRAWPDVCAPVLLRRTMLTAAASATPTGAAGTVLCACIALVWSASLYVLSIGWPNAWDGPKPSGCVW